MNDREFWSEIRRGLMMLVKAIDKKLGVKAEDQRQ